MPAYLSDRSDHRQLVAVTFKNEDGSWVNPGMIVKCRDLASEIVSMSARLPTANDPTALTKRDVLPFVIKNSYNLAVFKVTATPIEWMDFLLKLQQNKMTIRDVTAIKQAVESEFKQMYEDAVFDGVELPKDEDEARFQIFEGVKSITTYQGANGLTAKIEFH